MPDAGAAARPARSQDDEKETPLEPGGPLAVALITGDFDLSGIGTVTHIEGNRVYGWGHPFMSLGACEFPLMTGYIHTIYPRQTVSFKMGSPLRTVGVINADVSTCIAGWLGRKPDMLPVRMTRLARRRSDRRRTFNVQLVRQRVAAGRRSSSRSLTNSVDMEGDLPEEMTAELHARIELEGQPPLVIKDTFSGFSGGRAPAALYSQVARRGQSADVQPVQAGAHQAHRVRHAHRPRPPHRRHRGRRAGFRDLCARRHGQGHACSCGRTRATCSACRRR